MQEALHAFLSLILDLNLGEERSVMALRLLLQGVVPELAAATLSGVLMKLESIITPANSLFPLLGDFTKRPEGKLKDEVRSATPDGKEAAMVVMVAPMEEAIALVLKHRPPVPVLLLTSVDEVRAAHWGVSETSHSMPGPEQVSLQPPLTCVGFGVTHAQEARRCGPIRSLFPIKVDGKPEQAVDAQIAAAVGSGAVEVGQPVVVLLRDSGKRATMAVKVRGDAFSVCMRDASSISACCDAWAVAYHLEAALGAGRDVIELCGTLLAAAGRIGPRRLSVILLPSMDRCGCRGVEKQEVGHGGARAC